MKYGMVIDISKCVGCYNCQIACKDEFVENDWPPYSASQPDIGQLWMRVDEVVRGSIPRVKVSYIPTPCMHCGNAPCMSSDNGGAIYRRPDGIIIADPTKSAGQTEQPTCCPYGALYSNENTQVVQKCTFCVHLVESGYKQPRCAEACPVSSITLGDLDDPNSEVSKLVACGDAKPLHPEYGTNPHVYYIGLPKTFLAGSVTSTATGDYIKDALVELADDRGTTKSVKTNGFGDFEFEDLDPNRTYKLTISKDAMITTTRSILLDKDKHLGDIELKPQTVEQQ
jgi:Fe-S-cluster-containing dehydrogenase component